MLNIIEKTLCGADKRRLKAIYAPVVVTVPIEDARRNLCVMPDGEIRAYGLTEKKELIEEGKGGLAAYLSSRNAGLDWRLVVPSAERMMGPASRNPDTGRYVTVHTLSSEGNLGVFVRYSDTSPDDPDFVEKEIALDGIRLHQMPQPIYLSSRRRWIAFTHTLGADQHPVVLFSDDDGENWSVRHLCATPRHELLWPHKGQRWQNTGTEPALVERADGSLLLLARTSLDYLYQYFSYDGGESWTDGEPSSFHCTLTTPFFLKLQSGKILFFWNKTRPMAEIDQSAFSEEIQEGCSEDFFTNRDANHAAISEDGVHFEGMREMFLSAIRTAADFRLKGGAISSNDKSVHQFSAIELPYGKILVEFGQHEISRKTVIFDVNWLYEKERHEDFQRGLEALSTQMFVKSLPGHSRAPFGGHCAYNRTHGALLVPDPDATDGEALQICRVDDPRLVSPLQGAVWNFPAARKGKIMLEARIAGAGLALSLADHWIGPSDPYVIHYAAFTLSVTDETVSPNVWHKLTLDFDLDGGVLTLMADGAAIAAAKLQNDAPMGLSYLHMQTLAEKTDFRGSYIRSIDFWADR